MSDRQLRILAGVMAGFALLAALVTAVVSIVLGDVAQTVSAIVIASFPIVAVIIVRAQPRNGVAWVFLASAVLEGINSVGDRVGNYVLQHNGSETVAHIALWFTITWFPALFLLLTLALLYFPTGRLPTPRWRWLEVSTLVLMAIWTVGVGMAATTVPARELEGNGRPSGSGWVTVVFDIGVSAIVLTTPCVIGAVVSIIQRWRHSGPVERLQIRWVAAAGVLAVLAEIAVDIPPSFGVEITSDAQSVIEGVGLSLIAIATGIAILRYRLYEIDRIVSRTVSYAAITVFLGATYVGLVTLGSTVMPARYGSVGVAVATLAVAALFVPVRRGIQRRVDRRFNRSRYSATQTVERFATAIRSDLDQDAVSAELLRIVDRAVAPCAASIWVVPRR